MQVYYDNFTVVDWFTGQVLGVIHALIMDHFNALIRWW